MISLSSLMVDASRCLMKCGGIQTNAKKRDAALEEVRAAVEELVLAGGHAAELAPRSPDVMQAQAWSQGSPRRKCKLHRPWRVFADCGDPLLLVAYLRRHMWLQLYCQCQLHCSGRD